MSQVSAMSGVISPTNLPLFTSTGPTQRTTSRSTPIPRWSSSSTAFIPLDENLDYGMMAGLMPNTNPDVDPPHIIGAEGIHYMTLQFNEQTNKIL